MTLADHTGDADLLRAHLEAALDALSRVMATLATQAGSPAETRVWAAARALLAEHGRDPQREWRAKACEAWASRTPVDEPKEKP
jgi:hypothetical protein